MFSGPLVFVDVDTQRDFLDPAGLLYIQGSASILPKLFRLTSYALERAIPIIATACAHPSDDPEFKQFPPHCVIGTEGQARIPETSVANTIKPGPGVAYHGPLPGHLTLEKQTIDVFQRSEMGRLIAWYNEARPTFVVYGVATDYCVKAVVEGLNRHGCRTALVVDAVRAIHQERETDLLTELASHGTLLTLTEIVCES